MPADQIDAETQAPYSGAGHSLGADRRLTGGEREDQQRHRLKTDLEWERQHTRVGADDEHERVAGLDRGRTLRLMPSSAHRLALALESAGHGDFPTADGTIEVLPAPPGRAMAVVAFTSHYIIASSASEDWIRAQLSRDDLLAPMSPRFLTMLADNLGRHDDGIDLLLAARGLRGRTTLRETTAEGHARVKRAHAHRDDVRVFTDPTRAATIILGRGLANRTEIAIEIKPNRRNQGIARQALTEARRIIETDQLFFAQTPPGNAASLRTLLTAGFQPIGSEVLFFGNTPALA